MSTDILLNGVSIAELKKQKALIQKDASAFIADGIKEATNIIRGIVEDAEGEEEVDPAVTEKYAKMAIEILDNVALVSGVSGVTYELPYSEDGYYNETPLTIALENAGLEAYGDVQFINDLHNTLEDMEYNSRNWHSSRCW